MRINKVIFSFGYKLLISDSSPRPQIKNKVFIFKETIRKVKFINLIRPSFSGQTPVFCSTFIPSRSLAPESEAAIRPIPKIPLIPFNCIFSPHGASNYRSSIPVYSAISNSCCNWAPIPHQGHETIFSVI
jgi:hypothetical protein